MIYVEHNNFGVPLDPKWLNYPNLYDGINFIVFEDFDEKDEYCRKNYPNWYLEENIIDDNAS